MMRAMWTAKPAPHKTLHATLQPIDAQKLGVLGTGASHSGHLHWILFREENSSLRSLCLCPKAGDSRNQPPTAKRSFWVNGGAAETHMAQATPGAVLSLNATNYSPAQLAP